MGKYKNSGFTIIEVMLFLGITGILVASILVGASANINSQRYRDSVEQLRNVIQGQYDRAYSLTNDNADTSGNINPCNADSSMRKHRGTSTCYYVGRMIEITFDDTKGTSTLKMSPLIAERIDSTSTPPPVFSSAHDGVSSAADATGGSNTKPVQGYTVKRHTENAQLLEEWQVPWDLGIYQAGEAKRSMPQRAAILIVRSPVNGTLSTHVIPPESLNDETVANLAAVINDRLFSQELKLCVGDSLGELEPPTRMAVIVQKDATGPGSIESAGDSSGC